MGAPIDPRLRDGIAAAQGKRLEEARGLLQQAADAAPDNAVAWFWLGAVSPTADAAITHLRRALSLDPSYVAAREALARLLLAQANRMCDAARRLFRDAAAVAAVDDRVMSRFVESANATAKQLADDVGVAFARAEVRLQPDATSEEVRLKPDTTSEEVRSVRLQADPSSKEVHPPDTTEEVSSVRLQADPPSQHPEPAAARTVLVVDDSPTIRKILSLTLEHAGYAVVSEADGESAIRRLNEQRADVILLDIAMPGIDGYETCQRIRSDARTANVPILMLSGKDALFDKVKGHMAGASEYLTKPFEAATVLAAVEAACPPAA